MFKLLYRAREIMLLCREFLEGVVNIALRASARILSLGCPANLLVTGHGR